MLQAAAGVTIASYTGVNSVRCRAPSADDAGAGAYARPLLSETVGDSLLGASSIASNR